MRGQDGHGRVDAIFAAAARPMSSVGARNRWRSGLSIGWLHVLARLRRPARREWPAGLQRRGLAARDNRTTAIPPPSHSFSSQQWKKPLAADCHWLLSESITHGLAYALVPCRTLRTGHSAVQSAASLDQHRAGPLAL